MIGSLPKILDACCGSRMFWFDKDHPDVVFVDNRRESHIVDSRKGRQCIVVDPDLVADFRDLPFRDEQFSLVVFDPPHCPWPGKNSWLTKKYGGLRGDWRNDIKQGFKECFRVLKPDGILIFKWNETRIPVTKILELTSARPLIGNRCGKSAKTHWIVFMKPQHARQGGES